LCCLIHLHIAAVYPTCRSVCIFLVISGFVVLFAAPLLFVLGCRVFLLVVGFMGAPPHRAPPFTVRGSTGLSPVRRATAAAPRAVLLCRALRFLSCLVYLAAPGLVSLLRAFRGFHNSTHSTGRAVHLSPAAFTVLRLQRYRFTTGDDAGLFHRTVPPPPPPIVTCRLFVCSPLLRFPPCLPVFNLHVCAVWAGCAPLPPPAGYSPTSALRSGFAAVCAVAVQVGLPFRVLRLLKNVVLRLLRFCLHRRITALRTQTPFIIYLFVLRCVTTAFCWTLDLPSKQFCGCLPRVMVYPGSATPRSSSVLSVRVHLRCLRYSFTAACCCTPVVDFDGCFCTCAVRVAAGRLFSLGSGY